MSRRVLVAVLGIGLLAPMAASAALNFNIGFDPATVCPGNSVSFLFDLVNVGAQPSNVTLSVTFSYNGMQFGPFTGNFPMAAGQEFSQELPLMVPPFVPAGTLSITATATDQDGPVTSTASLEIQNCGNKVAAGVSAKPLVNNVTRMLRQLGAH